MLPSLITFLPHQSLFFLTFPYLFFPSHFAIDQNLEAADKQETGKPGVLILVFFK